MANHILLQKIRLTSSASSVTFANIPQSGYTDLKIVMSARNTTNPYSEAAIYYAIGFNGQGSLTNVTGKMVFGNGTSAISLNTPADFTAIGYMTSSGATASTFNNSEIYIPNYLGSTNKSFSVNSVSENNGTLSVASLFAGLWSQTAAITSITFTSRNGNFDTYSTFSLYGVAATGTSVTTGPKADGGNIITTDGTYWSHTFLSSGFFKPIQPLTCDYLVVAGGGGAGGGGPSGGGGAGGFLTSTALAVTATPYVITVGAGGSGGIVSGVQGTNGSNSIFASITATGGGKGGGYSTGEAQTGSNGGSGGGGAGGSANAGGSASPSGQGNNGGAGITGVTDNRPAGGGGGAGSAGTSASGSSGGNGGNGLSNSYSGTSVTYAGGGGGGAGTASTAAGTGGTGGGGNGSKSGSGSAGTANLGGGGGGAQNSGSGGNGGSGIIIIRYPV